VPAPKQDLSTLKFLAIDDMATHRDLLKSMLWRANVRSIDLACDGADAIKHISQNTYDVILCDYNLGDGQDGQQVLEEAMTRNLLPYATLYVMITAENTSNMVMGAMEYSPDDYLIKPINEQLLTLRVSRLLEKKSIFKEVYKASTKKDYETAIKLCDELIKTHRKMALEIFKTKGGFCLKAKKFEAAEKVYSSVLKKREYQWASLGLGEALLELEKYDEAKKLFNKLIIVNHNCVEAYDFLAILYLQTDDNIKAQEALEQTVRISPKSLVRQRKLANVAYDNEDYVVAETAFQRAMFLGEHSYLRLVDDHIGMAKTYEKQGERDKVKTMFFNIQKFFKNHPESRIRAEIANSLMIKESGDYFQAKIMFEKLKKAFVNLNLRQAEDELVADMGAICIEFGDEETAKNSALNTDYILDEIAKNNEKYKKINQDGMAFFKQGEFSKAIEEFSNVAELQPEVISFQLNAAQAIIKLTENGEGNDSLKKQMKAFLEAARQLDRSNERLQKLKDIAKSL